MTHGWEFYLQNNSQLSQQKNMLRGYRKFQLIFGRYIILTIKHKVDWDLIRQKNQNQINKYNIR